VLRTVAEKMTSAIICIILGAFRIEASRSVFIFVCLNVLTSYDQVKDEMVKACTTHRGEACTYEEGADKSLAL
jgi:hypothetical protein